VGDGSGVSERKQLSLPRSTNIVWITRERKNQLLGAIGRAGLNVAEFEYLQGDHEDSYRQLAGLVMHTPSERWFRFEHRAMRPVDAAIFHAARLLRAASDPWPSLLCSWTPGDAGFLDRVSVSSWEEALPHFEHWLDHLKAAHEPDLWAQVRAGAGDDASGHFTLAERVELSSALSLIAERLADLAQLSAQRRQTFVIEFSQPLEDASTKLVRGQWKLMFYGALISKAVDLGLNLHVIGDVGAFAMNLIGHLFGRGLPELPRSPGDRPAV
jgi:hypothetical protein